MWNMHPAQAVLHVSYLYIIFRYLCNSSFGDSDVFLFRVFHVGTKQFNSPLLLPLNYFLLSSNVYVPPLCSSSSLWRPLLRAVWCHPLPGVARLLQRLPELWVGHWGRARKLHQNQLWQVCMAVLQQFSHGNKDTIHSHRFTHSVL